jgi:hypothetical protein
LCDLIAAQEAVMTPEDNDRMLELCKAMQSEQEQTKLTELAEELTRLLDKRQANKIVRGTPPCSQ